MLFQIARGKLKVILDDPDPEARLFQLTQLKAVIGSANEQAEDDGDPAPSSRSETEDVNRLLVNCAISVQNLRKLRRLFPGIRSVHDTLTDEVMQGLVAKHDAYKAQSALGEKIKNDPAYVEDAIARSGYQFHRPPFAHQRSGFVYIRELETPALFGDPGIGKTAIVLTAFESLVKTGKWVGLVVCPVNLIDHVWRDEAAAYTGLSTVSLRVRGSTPALRRKRLTEALLTDADLYVVNPEQIRAVDKDTEKERGVAALLRRRKKEGYSVYLIIDESSKMKSRQSATYKSIRRIREKFADRCVIMTGSPAPNGFADLWPQFHVLDEGQTLQPSYTDYRNDVCVEKQLRGVTWIDHSGKTQMAKKWVDRPGIAAQIHQMIEPRVIRFRADACLDLPPQTILYRDVELPVQHRELYDQMEERLFLELEGEEVTSRVAATKLMKLREITGGFLITDVGSTKPISDKIPKAEELDALLQQCIGPKLGDQGVVNKAIVWAQFRWECAMLLDRYSTRYGAHGMFGGISDSRRDEAYTKFRTDPHTKLLICHPQSVGHGLTLVEANYAFYYSYSYDYEELYQSSKRIRRAGQQRPTFYYFLVAPDTVDEDMLAALARKQGVSDLIKDGHFSRDALLARRKRDRIDLGGHDVTSPAEAGG